MFQATRYRFVRLVACAVSLSASVALVLGVTSDPSSAPASAATPVAMPPAICTPPEVLTATPATPATTSAIPVAADAEIAAQITTAVANLIACWNDAAWEPSVALVTDGYLQATTGTADRAAVVALLQRLTAAGLTVSASLDSVDDVRSRGAGFSSVEVVWSHGNALKHERWHFVAVQGTWLLDETESLEPAVTGNAVGIGATIDRVRLQLSREQLVSPGIVVIHVRNQSAESTSLTVFRSPSAAELRERLAGLVARTGESVLVGDLVIPAGEEADLVLIGLSADVYTVVAGLHDTGGTLQVRDPFSATLNVATS
ncbi:MAG: hypothetical protein QOF01_3300 [Thermomicrobiales bacterium]|nr:hypothetical protein [Thermomicrobiales bacterium]